MSSKDQKFVPKKEPLPGLLVTGAHKDARIVVGLPAAEKPKELTARRLLMFISRVAPGTRILVSYPDEAGRVITFLDTLDEVRPVIRHNPSSIGLYLALRHRRRSGTDYGGVFADDLYAISKVRADARSVRIHDPDGSKFLKMLDRYAVE